MIRVHSIPPEPSQNFVKKKGFGKAGCPYDNSPMESFYGTFKSEFIRQNRFETDQELNESTLDYVYGYYNHIRPHSSNGYMTPFEKRYSNQCFFQCECYKNT